MLRQSRLSIDVGGRRLLATIKTLSGFDFSFQAPARILLVLISRPVPPLARRDDQGVPAPSTRAERASERGAGSNDLRRFSRSRANSASR
jgi:hypothetical protein